MRLPGVAVAAKAERPLGDGEDNMSHRDSAEQRLVQMLGERERMFGGA